MVKKLVPGAFALLFSVQAALAGVGFDGGKFYLKEELSALGVSAPAAVAQRARPEKEWTIMVYVNAKNNLEKFGLKDMNEMELVGSGDRHNVVVELGRMAGYDDSDGDWTGARRYLVRRDGDPAAITSPVVRELPGADMGDYKHLVEFGRWAKAAYPAKKYMLIVWNHGSGWDKGRALNGARGISYDDETGNYINTPQLAQALKEMGGVDVYGSDACLMQMAEVVYEIKDHAKYVVGSEETEPGDGYTYDAFLAPLAARPDMTAEELARTAVDAYADHYKAAGKPTTQSYVRTSAAPGFRAASDAFARALMLAGDKEAAYQALRGAQSYATQANKDLYHFAQLAAAGTHNSDVKAKAEALMAFIKDVFVGHNRTTDELESWWNPVNYDDSHGIAVYLPAGAAPESYAGLRWAGDSAWDEFLAWLEPAARRSDAAVGEFQTMGRYEGVRVDDRTALVGIETQLMVNGTPGFVQLAVNYQEIPKDQEALAVDPGALVTVVDIPLAHYSAIFEGEPLFMKEWAAGGKNIEVFSSHDGRTKFIQFTLTSGNAPGAPRTTEVLKLTVAGKEITMGQLEKFRAGGDDPYFSEYVVMPERTAGGLALKTPGLAGRLSDPSLIKYAAEAPTPERFAEVLRRGGR
ncbi:MAG: hypothetical protein HY952_08395 [Elusimicrobia bacterium]|nr:hypothetical protein [Elusimicrobiota bacterium]